jgi:8-oxo-dGTP diphosphatase
MVQYSLPVASHSAECVIFGFVDKELKVLLIKRASLPFIDEWALPSGFMEEHETLEEAAERLLDHLTGISKVNLTQIGTYSLLNRHPSGRVIATAFYGLVRPENYWLNPTWHAKEAIWQDTHTIPHLAFDHNDIIKKALGILNTEIQISPIAFDLVPVKFTLAELQSAFEAILQEKIDKRNFRRKMENMGILIQLDDLRIGAHIDAKQFAFNKSEYEAKKKEGFTFKI